MSSRSAPTATTWATAGTRSTRSSASSRRHHSDRELERALHRRRARDAFARDVVRGAVIGRRAHDRQPERDVDRLVEVDELDRDQALVVIHRDERVVAAVTGVAERGVGDEWT